MMRTQSREKATQHLETIRNVETAPKMATRRPIVVDATMRRRYPTRDIKRMSDRAGVRSIFAIIFYKIPWKNQIPPIPRTTARLHSLNVHTVHVPRSVGGYHTRLSLSRPGFESRRGNDFFVFLHRGRRPRRPLSNETICASNGEVWGRWWTLTREGLSTAL